MAGTAQCSQCRSALLSVLQQLEQSQWWSKEQILRQQLRQISNLLRYSVTHSPFYRNRIRLPDKVTHENKSISYKEWQNILILSREEVQSNNSELSCRILPAGHKKIGEAITSGSTGRPISTIKTNITSFFWNVLALRDMFWHKINFSNNLASIRAVGHDRAAFPEGKISTHWGGAIGKLYKTGSASLLSIQTSSEQQIDWLSRQNAQFLITFPSNLKALAEHCLKHGIKPPELHIIQTLGETVDESLRSLCRKVFGVKLVDIYSSQECGYLALSCPETNSYHVQSENVLLEIINKDNKPCLPGEVGRVVW